MSQKNTLFNYFQRAKPSPTAPSENKKTISLGGKKSSSSQDNNTFTSVAKNPPKGQTPTGKSTSNSVTPKRPRPKGAKSDSSEKGKGGVAKPYKRLRLISDDEDSENDQSLANGKASESGEPATKPPAEPVDSEQLNALPDEHSEDEYKRECVF